MKGGAADSFVLQHDVPSIFAGHYDPSFYTDLNGRQARLSPQPGQSTIATPLGNIGPKRLMDLEFDVCALAYS